MIHQHLSYFHYLLLGHFWNHSLWSLHGCLPLLCDLYLILGLIFLWKPISFSVCFPITRRNPFLHLPLVNNGVSTREVVNCHPHPSTPPPLHHYMLHLLKIIWPYGPENIRIGMLVQNLDPSVSQIETECPRSKILYFEHVAEETENCFNWIKIEGEKGWGKCPAGRRWKLNWDGNLFCNYLTLECNPLLFIYLFQMHKTVSKVKYIFFSDLYWSIYNIHLERVSKYWIILSQIARSR